jgi:AraC family transcriptional regulator, regulatory protein of adaptative response / methylated-DNA-[protein]-cysteine methyltransferase
MAHIDARSPATRLAAKRSSIMTSVQTRIDDNPSTVGGIEGHECAAREHDRSADAAIRPNLPIQFGVGTCWLGSILVAASHKGICAILLGDDPAVLRRDLEDRFPETQLAEDGDALERLTDRVAAFVEAPNQDLAMPLDPRGTAFQQRVWHALREIPAGSTASYTDIAARIGAPNEAYAVGEACAANMIAVAIPCHRVVRKDGTLAGYRWGFWRKRALLKREGVR